MKEYKTAQKRVIGLGSAKEGVGHWWRQRVSALALVPLGIWFVTSMVLLVGADYAMWRAWVASPWNVGAMALFLFTFLYHGYLGLQVVIEDYVPSHGARLFWLLSLQFLAWLLGAAGAVSLLTIFTGL